MDRHNQKPDFFALLGYENGLVIRANTGAHKNELNERINNQSIPGPRGVISFEKGKTAFEYTLWEQVPHTTNLSGKTKKTVLPNLSEKTIPLESQGWYNAYLCH